MSSKPYLYTYTPYEMAKTHTLRIMPSLVMSHTSSHVHSYVLLQVILRVPVTCSLESVTLGGRSPPVWQVRGYQPSSMQVHFHATEIHSVYCNVCAMYIYTLYTAMYMQCIYTFCILQCTCRCCLHIVHTRIALG